MRGPLKVNLDLSAVITLSSQ